VKLLVTFDVKQDVIKLVCNML